MVGSPLVLLSVLHHPDGVSCPLPQEAIDGADDDLRNEVQQWDGDDCERDCPQADALNLDVILKDRDLDAWRQGCP